MISARREGFALVITVVLLALVVITMLGLGTLTRVSAGVASAAGYRAQARQNAIMGLDVGLGELQRLAGDDTRITGMAGIAGVPPDATATTRHWCGVWQSDGAFMGWLASGASAVPVAPPDSIELIAAGSVGPASSTSVNVEKQHVVAGRIGIHVPGLTGGPVLSGRYAYVVIDEGVKIGACAPVAQRARPDAVPAIAGSVLTNQLKLKTALENNSSLLPAMLSYEQLGLLPPVTPSVLQDCFHYVSLTPRMIAGGGYRTGMINVNTASPLVWRSLLDTYNRMPGTSPVPNVTSKANELAAGIAATTAGKKADEPFTATAGLAAYVETLFPSSGSPTAGEIMETLGPLLTTRSDTFRIRAYGEAVNPADATRIEATGWCEAIVQRTPAPMPQGEFGRRFVIAYFRWLGPDDI